MDYTRGEEAVFPGAGQAEPLLEHVEDKEPCLQNFAATNTAEPRTDVDISQLVYAVKPEFLASGLPPTSQASLEPFSADSSALGKLNQIISDFAKGAVKNTKEETVPEKCKLLYKKLSTLAESAKVRADSDAEALKFAVENPSLAQEVELFRSVSSKMADMLQNPDMAASALSSEAFIKFLSTSVLLNETYEKTGQLLDNAVNEALKSGTSKQVIRICEIGGANSALSKRIIRKMADRIREGRIEYIYTSNTSESFKPIMEEFTELKTIKYEIFDPMQGQKSDKFAPGSFDIVLHNNFPRMLPAEALEQIHDILTVDGWFVTLKHSNTTDLYYFASGTDDLPDMNDETLNVVLKCNGFKDTRIISPPSPSLASVVLTKRTEPPARPLIGDLWLIINRYGSLNPPAIDILEKQLPGEVLSFTTDGLSAVEEAIDQKKRTNLLYFMGKDDSAVTTSLQLAELLLTLENTTNLSVWIFTSGAYVSQNTMPATLSGGIFRSVQNKCSFPVQCVDVHPGTAGEFSGSILQALTSIGGNIREAAVRTPILRIPKIVRIPLKPTGEESPENMADIRFRDDVTYLVTGGYGRLGREFSRWLGRKGARHIALVSRAGPTDIHQKSTIRYIQSQGVSQGESKEESQAKSQAKSHGVPEGKFQGVTVYILRGDVGVKAEVEAMFAELQQQGAPGVRGIFHLAGYTENPTTAGEEEQNPAFPQEEENPAFPQEEENPAPATAGEEEQNPAFPQEEQDPASAGYAENPAFPREEENSAPAGEEENPAPAGEEDLRAAVRAQCVGAENLSQVSIDLGITLDYFVLFGSAVSSWAHPDLPNTCACSQHLDAVSATRRYRGHVSQTILLGQVRGAGNDEDVVCLMEKAGMKSLHISEYLDIIGTLLTKQGLPASVFISHQDWKKTAEMTYPNSTRFSSLVPGTRL